MPSFDATTFTLLAVFALAGFVKGVTGMGLPTVAMGLAGALVGPLAAAGLLLVPSLITNVWQLLAGGGLLPLLRRFGTMMAGIVGGTLAGSTFLARGEAGASTAALGLALALYALVALLAPPFRVPPRAERFASPLVGLATGLVTGATGVFVIPAVPYIQSLGLARDDLVQALGLSFTVSTLALAAGLALHGAVPAASLGTSVLLVVPALLGMAAGQRLRARIAPALFRRIFLVGLLALGAEMALR